MSFTPSVRKPRSSPQKNEPFNQETHLKIPLSSQGWNGQILNQVVESQLFTSLWSQHSGSCPPSRRFANCYTRHLSEFQSVHGSKARLGFFFFFFLPFPSPFLLSFLFLPASSKKSLNRDKGLRGRQLALSPEEEGGGGARIRAGREQGRETLPGSPHHQRPEKKVNEWREITQKRISRGTSPSSPPLQHHAKSETAWSMGKEREGESLKIHFPSRERGGIERPVPEASDASALQTHSPVHSCSHKSWEANCGDTGATVDKKGKNTEMSQARHRQGLRQRCFQRYPLKKGPGSGID